MDASKYRGPSQFKINIICNASGHHLSVCPLGQLPLAAEPLPLPLAELQQSLLAALG